MCDMSDLDKIANELYGQNYASLSSFGQEAVRLELPRTGSIADYEKDKLIVDLTDKIAQLTKENKELWEDNEDLQLELQNRDEEDELRTTRRTREPEAPTGLPTPRTNASLDDIRRLAESDLP